MSAGSDARVYLCVSIDCECDKGPGWKIRKPLAFSAVAAGIGERLQPLFRSFAAKPTYLLSPEVIADPASVEALRRLDGSCELGTHLHGEFAAPGAFVPDETTAFQCGYDLETKRAKLHSLTASFRDAFGYQPRSFRAGRFGIGPHSLGFLAQLGYTVDSSVTPHKDWAAAGAPEASFHRAPTQPYWPVFSRPEAVADRPGPLLEVPVTIRPSRFAAFPVLARLIEPRWLRPTKGSIARLVAVARDEIQSARGFGRPIVLNCMFHNVEIMPGTSPYADTPADAAAILARLAGLLDFARREDIACIGLGDVPALFARSAAAVCS